MSELVLFRQGMEVLRVGLEHQRMVLGSGAGSDIVLPDPDLSRQQVALTHDGTRCVLEDLSGRGTLVCGKPMKHGELVDGADLVLGQWRAVFRLHGTSDPEAGPGGGKHTDIQSREGLEARLPPAQLRVKQGSTEFIHPIGAESFTLGKDPGNDVVVQDPFISNQHLRVIRSPAGFLVRDLNSTNGTFLDSTRLIEAEVALHTVLRVGETELHFEPVSKAGREAPFHGIIGKDPAMRQLVELIQRVARSDAPVSILGESGTGKELVAKALHNYSPRSNQRFIPLNCAAISPALIESELFGHEKGAFTGADVKRKGAFQEAHGGTLFLDEVGELPIELQAKLLRALENGEIKPVGATHPLIVDVRVVAATHRELLAATREEKFREDLYYRLSVLPLRLPPLRNRRADIRLLAEHFVRAHAPRNQKVKLTPAALAMLQEHSWPGNVRELRNVVLRALVLRKGPKLDATELVFDEEPQGVEQATRGLPLQLPEGVTLEQMMRRVERELVENTLRRFDNNKERTAKALGLARSSLFKRLKDWNIT